jgi:hypothetical protein
MTDADVLRRLGEERRSLSRDMEVLELLPSVTRLRASDGSHHAVIWSSLTTTNADAEIAAQVEYYRKLGVGFEWKAYSHDAPPDLVDRLRRHNFDIGPLEAVLVRPVDAPPSPVAAIDAAVDVRRVERPEQLADFKRAAEAVFGKDYSFTTEQLADGLKAGSTEHLGYVAYVGGEPVGVSRLYTHPASWFGGLYGGGTVASHRGKGVYRAMVAARARDAAVLGARFLQVDSLPTSRPVLERIGFRRLTDTWPCEWRPVPWRPVP